jgi:5-methylcytosine-specific restriction enzyme B
MLEGQQVTIGWDAIGDLSWVNRKQDDKDRLRAALEKEYYPGQVQLASRKAGEVFNFVATMDLGDLVLAADGEKILGVGRVSGSYRYDPAPDPRAPHHRPVDWLDTAEWQLPMSEGLRTTVVQIRKNPRNLVAVEERLLLPASPAPVEAKSPRTGSMEPLTGIPGRIEEILERKGQAIFGRERAQVVLLPVNLDLLSNVIDLLPSRRVEGEWSQGDTGPPLGTHNQLI